MYLKHILNITIHTILTTKFKLMKTKSIFASMMLCVLCLMGCNQNNPEEQQKEDPETTVLDPAYCTNVTIRENSYSGCEVVIDNIYIYDKNDKQVGSGKYFASYLVPYDGYMLLSYHSNLYVYDHNYHWEYGRGYENQRVDVGSAHALVVSLICYGNDGTVTMTITSE